MHDGTKFKVNNIVLDPRRLTLDFYPLDLSSAARLRFHVATAA